MPHEYKSVALIKVPRIPDLTVPNGAQARVQFEDNDELVGLVRAELIIESGGRRVNTRRLNISLDLYAKSYGVTSELKRGHVLTREDFMVLQVPASQMPRDAIERPELFEGSELRRRVRPVSHLGRLGSRCLRSSLEEIECALSPAAGAFNSRRLVRR